MAGTLKTIFDVVGRDVGATATNNRVAASFRNMTASARAANTQMMGANAQIDKQQQRMNAAFKEIAVGAGLMKLGGGITGFMKDATKQAGDFQLELVTLGGISQASAKDLDILAAKARQLGIETRYDPTEALQAMQAIAQQGFTTAQQLEAIPAVLSMGAAGGGRVSLEESAKLTTQTLKAFGLEAGKAGITVDQLVKTTTMSGLAIEELAEGLQNASSGAIVMGLNVKQSMAALGLIKNIIPSAAMAGSAFQIMVNRLSDPRVQKLLKKSLGVDVVDKATGNYRDFNTILVELSSQMAKMATGKRGALVTEAFGARAQKGILTIFQQLTKGVTTTTGEVVRGRKAMDYFLKELDETKVAGFAENLANMKLDTLNGQLVLLRGSISTFMQDLGKGTAELTQGAVKMFLGMFNSMLEIFTSLPKPVRNLISGFVLLSGVMIKLIGIVVIAKGVMSLLGLSMGGIFLTIGKILLVAGPLLLTLGAIGLAVYGVYKAVSTNFGKAGEAGGNLFDKIKLGYRGVVDIISTGGLSKAVVEDLKKAENKGVGRFLTTVESWIGKLKSFFHGISEGFTNNLEKLRGPWLELKSIISDIFSGWLDDARQSGASTDLWNKRGQYLGGTLAGIAAKTLELFNHLLRVGGQLAKTFDVATIEGFFDKIAALVTLFDRMLGFLESITSKVTWLIDSIQTVGTIGKKTEDLTVSEMQSRLGVMGKTGGKQEFLKELEDIQALGKTGFFGGFGGKIRKRQAIETAYVRQMDFGSMLDTGKYAGVKGTRAGFLPGETAKDALDRIIDAQEQVTSTYKRSKEMEGIINRINAGQAFGDKDVGLLTQSYEQAVLHGNDDLAKRLAAILERISDKPIEISIDGEVLAKVQRRNDEINASEDLTNPQMSEASQ